MFSTAVYLRSTYFVISDVKGCQSLNNSNPDMRRVRIVAVPFKAVEYDLCVSTRPLVDEHSTTTTRFHYIRAILICRASSHWICDKPYSRSATKTTDTCEMCT